MSNLKITLVVGAVCLANVCTLHAASAEVLSPENYRHYIETFNAEDPEPYPAAIRNTNAWAVLRDNIPLFDCPDKSFEEIYYFRWWIYQQHIRATPDGYVITEFLPEVAWAGKYNSINCAAAHHFNEGRWLHDPKSLDDYAVFWLRKGGSVRSYSFWIADVLWNRALVTDDRRQVKELFPDLVANYAEWEKTHRGPTGLFWQTDDHDGMEMSIGGSGYRPTINSYLFADARAIASIADLLGETNKAVQFRARAATLKRLVQEKLWNADQQFFEVLPDGSPMAKPAGVREEIGFTPWYVNLPDAGYEAAWQQLMDTNGFYAPFGPTTAEQRHAGFKLSYQGHECQWNGPSWPFATAITLTAMANLLDNYHQNIITKDDYFKILQNYAKSQHLQRDDGKVVPWIDEDLNPFTGDWMARTIMKTQPGQIYERGRNYNHSTFCDLVITGLVGLRPRADDTVEVSPLVPDGTWDHFCLDDVAYHGHRLTILYDRSGKYYGHGRGLRVFADGQEIAAAPKLEHVTGTLPL